MQAQTNSTIAKQLRSVAAAASAKAKPAPKAAPSKPAKAAPAATATTVQATPAVSAAAPAYKLGKAFAPKAVGKYPQVENWTVVCATVPATKEALIAAIKAAGFENAAGFVQARIRKGHVVPV